MAKAPAIAARYRSTTKVGLGLAWESYVVDLLTACRYKSGLPEGLRVRVLSHICPTYATSKHCCPATTLGNLGPPEGT